MKSLLWQYYQKKNETIHKSRWTEGRKEEKEERSGKENEKKRRRRKEAAPTYRSDCCVYACTFSPAARLLGTAQSRLTQVPIDAKYFFARGCGK